MGGRMKKIGSRGMLAMILWAITLSPALAGRPLITEDAGTAEKGFFELELAVDYGRDNNGDNSVTPSAQLAYGLNERAEVAIAGGYLFKRMADNGWEDGPGDLNAYLKYRILGEREYYPGFTLKPWIKIPTADEDKGLGSGKTDLGLTAVMSKSFTGFNLHLNAGYTLIGAKDATDEMNLALAGEYEVTKGLIAVAEIRYNQNFNSDRKDDPANFLAGVQVAVGKAQFDAGLTIGLNRAAPDYVLTAGVTIKFH